LAAPRTVIDLSDMVPTKTQYAFLMDRTRVRAMIGGVGSGKSRTLMEAAVSAAVENPGCDGMLVAPTFPMLWRILIPAWEKACPRELRPRHLKGEQRYVMWHGGSVWYGTAKDPSSLEGTNLAWYAGDESRYWPRQSHVNMLSRLRLATARSQGVPDVDA
jgi:phage terminase large subunit-like protein